MRKFGVWGNRMIGASGASSTFNYLTTIGPLCGVVVGAGLTWVIQRNEWGRQRRWELKRDAVLDAIRAHADLESALVNLNSCLSSAVKRPTDETDTQVKAAAQRFRMSRTSFWCAHRIADLAVGGAFSNAMSTFFLLTGAVSKD